MTESPHLQPLPRAAQRRGRLLAYTSHPFGMTFAMVFTQPLPTLALLSLGAGETLIGVQSALLPVCLLLQLPTLRAVARLPKRAILVGAHAFAVLAATPLLAFASFASAGPLGPLAALGCLALVAAGLSVSSTVWFPLLRGYVEPGRIGRFFGTLRTGWHLALIVYFLASRWWLEHHPGVFAPLFAAGWLLGLLRIPLIARLPERSERTGEGIRVREALVLAREPRMRRYLVGVSWARAAQLATLPFVLVLLRRELGFSDAAVVITSVATFAGGMVSLFPWGGIVDRFGAAPVFRATCLGMAALVLSLLALREAGGAGLALATAFFFLHAVLSAGFGVADTHVLFGLAPAHAPSRALVLGAVAVGSVAGPAPAVAGAVLDAVLAGSDAPLAVYRGFFVLMAALQAFAFLPLRGFGAEPRSR